MRFEYPVFGTIVVDNSKFDHDIVLDDGELRPRDKGPSKSLKGRYGHTPLSAAEDLPWSKPRLIIGSGYSGRLPVMEEIEEEAARRGVKVEVMKTEDAVRVLNESDQTSLNAILHVTC